MSLSGSDVLALIERMHNDTRSEIAGVDTRLARFTLELETLRQRELGVLSVLARIRMREIEGGELKAALDETGRRVKELLAQREGALAAVGEELAAAERQKAALEQERAAQQAVVDAAEKAVDEAEAAAQQGLGADSDYRAKLEAAAASDNVADSAEAKATAAHADRGAEGQAVRGRSAVRVSLGPRLRHAGIRARRARRARSTAGSRASRASSRCAATTGC